MAESMRKHRSVSGGGWQPQVAGGGTLRFSPPSSAICHRLSHHLISGGRWRDMMLHWVGARLRRVRGRTNVIRSVIMTGTSHVLRRPGAMAWAALPASDYVVTRSRPYPMQSLCTHSRWRVAAPGGGWQDLKLHRVGARLRRVRGRTDVIRSVIMPSTSHVLRRTDATQSRPYP